MTRKKRLGRGLEALLSAVEEPVSRNAPINDIEEESYGSAISTSATLAPGETSDIVRLNVYEIDENPFQPRREFSEPEIASLAESLKDHDLLQPILVRVVNGRHQLISGERRLRAAISAGWSTIPARIREANDRLVAELAIVENLQREDLNPLEKALSFRRYLDEHDSTQEELARRLKLDRSTIANLMRLLELPRQVQQAVTDGDLSAGHARALLPLGDEFAQVEMTKLIKDQGLSVRETERNVAERIRREEGESIPFSATTKKRSRNYQIEALEKEFKMALGTAVQIRPGRGGRGSIVLNFKNQKEFDRLRELMVGSGSAGRVA